MPCLALKGFCVCALTLSTSEILDCRQKRNLHPLRETLLLRRVQQPQPVMKQRVWREQLLEQQQGQLPWAWQLLPLAMHLWEVWMIM